ncbi:MAG: PQQ-binding-like beta-propeller repeat protein [Bacteroides sp.]|nr:PQQ-binding-like beta-propeller repeat protein [Bacteroides sp.]
MRNLSLILIFTVSFASMEAQSTQFRGTDRNGIYPDTGLLELWPEQGPQLLASIEDIGDGYGSPSMNERGLYIAGMIDSMGYLFHYNFEQKLLWKVLYGKEYTYKYTGARGTPTLEENRLYYSGSYGDAFCLNNETGAFIWRKNIFDTYHSKTSKWGYTESPLLYKNLVILTPGGPGQNVVALDKMTGEEIWSINLDSAVNAYNSPILIKHEGEEYFMLNTTKNLLLIRPESGIVSFSHPIEQGSNMHAISGLYTNGRIFFSSGYGQGSALLNLNENTGGMDTIYSTTDLDCKLSGLIPYQGTIFGTSDKKKHWIGVDLESGETLFTSRELKPGSFLLADDKFFIFTETGEVALAVPGKEGFSVISRFHIPVQPAQLAFAHPVLHRGILYIRYREHLWLFNVNDH